MLKFFQISKSTYFYNISNYGKQNPDEELEVLITHIFNRESSTFGYRRIDLALRNIGLIVNHKKVKRIMSKLGLYGKTPKAKYKSYKGDVGKVAVNLLLTKEVDKVKNTTTYKRNFKTTSINQIWSSDVTEFHISSGKLYLSPIFDLHNNEIISYDVSRSPNFSQTTNMLNIAFSKYKDLKGLIFHTDQGWQYQMKSFVEMLKNKNIKQSMSRKGNCLDNSPMESFFGRMKNEMFYGNEFSFKSLEQLKKAIDDYIYYYNNNRITVKLKGLTPIQYRNQSLS